MEKMEAQWFLWRKWRHDGFYGENGGMKIAENIKAELLMKANFASSFYSHNTSGHKVHKWARA